MPILPSHQEVHYEPLGKPSSSHANHNTNKSTLVAKLVHRRLIIGLIIICVLGTFSLSKVYNSYEHDSISSKTQRISNKWDSLVSPSSDALKVGLDKKKAPPIPACSVVSPPAQPSPVFTSLPQTTNVIQVEQEHLIAEEDWHMPSDVHLLDSDPLWVSRRRPFFTQIKGDVHREFGFGGTQSVKLTEAPFVRRSLYRHLLQSFNNFAVHHEFHFWLAHGSLLGQYWGQKIMTGDTDIDVQCSLGDLHRVRPYEQQLWEDRFELVVNPHYLIRKTRNYRGLGLDKNVIDARWIDVLTGYYIDITALSALQADSPLTDTAPFLEFEEGKKAVTIQDKSPHKYDIGRISPTKRCQFEGINMWCPNQINEVLEEEYKKTYSHPQFHTWRFNQTIQAFNEVSCPQLMKMYQHPNIDNCDSECKEVVKHDRQLHWSALVMTGDIRKMGCLLKVIYKDGDESTFREYWGREDLHNKIKLRNLNTTYPGIVL
jgi:hypothetical protein